jgi:translocation and assembly module TamB
MRPVVRRISWVAGAALGLVVVVGVGVWIAGNTDAGRALIERFTYRLTDGHVKLAGLKGEFPSRLTLERLELSDAAGVWLSADRVAVRWSPLALLEQRIQVDELQAARVHMERTPIAGKSGGSAFVPHVEVGSFTLEVVELGAPLTGTAATLTAAGNLKLRSLTDAGGELVARRQDGEGEYRLRLRLDAKRMDAALTLHEPANGPLENLLSLPGLGALSATATLAGPRNAERIDAVLDAGGLHGELRGNVDFKGESADLDFSLKAPAMAPRPMLSWDQVSVEGRWHGPWMGAAGSGSLQASGLRIAGETRIAELKANLSAEAGRLSARSVVKGLELPGPQPRLFAADPVSIEASILLREASRPLELTASHPLFDLHAHADTASPGPAGRRAAATLRLADIQPFAALVSQDVRGTAVIEAELTDTPTDDALTLDAGLGLTGGTAGWLALAGPRPHLKLAGVLSEGSLLIHTLRLDADAATLTASGSAARVAGAPTVAAGLKDLDVRWQLEAQDLHRLSDDVAGNFKASGQLSGSPAALAADAEMTSSLSIRGSPTGTVDARVSMRGLPAAPGGSIQAHGMLDGAPLMLDAAVDRTGDHGYRLRVQQADWKSAHIEGDATSDAELNGSRGQLHLRMGDLADLDRLLGQNLSGSVEGSMSFAPGHAHPEAHIDINGRNLVVGPMAGDVHLEAQGAADALAVQVSAKLPTFYGAPGAMTAAATLNLGARELRVSSITADYRSATFRLLAPASVSFANGTSVDDLKVGANGALFELSGQLAPALDVRASTQVGPGLVNVFAPGLLAGGTIEGRARLRGSASSPSGRIRIDASGLKFADDAAVGLPPVEMHARAQLSDDTATVDAKLDAGSASQLTASGSVPLKAGGALDLKIGGKLDLGLANPLLEARGLRATGALTLAATLNGSADAPQVGGGITLSGGSLRDYAHGVNLSDIQAQIEGGDGGVQIKTFTARAASGTLAMTGTFGVLQHGMPVDLKITADKARPIESSIITTVLDADLHVAGTALERLDVSGTIRVDRATIGIPDTLPPDVAVLDVRRRGQGAPAPGGGKLVVGLDVAIRAPQQILVQGRGLDAELGGDIHLGGTSDDPEVSGGFDLQRGSFTIAGNKLNLTPPGRVGFDGAGLRKSIDPTLDFTATSTVSSPTVSNATVTLKISGLADAPQFEFTSNPTLPQDEIMALLLFGESAAQLTALQAAEIGAALATLSGIGGGGANPLVKLQKTLGLDRLSVGSNTTTTATGGTENSGAAIAAGRYVSKRIYIEGKQTTAGTSQVQVDVDLTQHLKLQTRLGNGTAAVQGTSPENDPGSSVGISYQFEY